MNRSTTVCAKCFVPKCKNTTTNSRNKLFVNISETLKKKWCKELDVEYTPGKRMFCCEDHLKLEEDLENYQYYKLMKGRPKLKPTAKLRVPKDLPSSSAINICDTPVTEELSCLKSLLLQPIENLPKELQPIHTTTQTQADCKDDDITDIKPTDKSASTHPMEIEAVTQNKHVKMIDQTPTTDLTEITKILPMSSTSSPFDTSNPSFNVKMIDQSESTRDIIQITKILPMSSTSSPFDTSNPSLDVKMIDQSESTRDIIHIAKILPMSSTSPFETTSNPSLNGCTCGAKAQRGHNARNQMMQFITNNPKAYIGLPNQCFWLINHIVTESATEVTELDIVIALLKIKLNDPVNRICDLFQISRDKYLQCMHTGIQVLENFFQHLIYMPTLQQIKQNQPLVFKSRYPNVCLLLDALEIEIKKPHNPVQQAQTWSKHKHANTVKYLIGSTPNGFVSYVSMGYGGSISNKALVEKSGLIDFLPDNAVIMANRDFKETEALLMVRGIKLLHLPSINASNNPTKMQVVQNKVAATLRAYVERVIMRVREFRLLKPHSVVSHMLVGYLDDLVLIACGLINLQSEINNKK